MVQIKADGSKFLNEDFIDHIFSEIYNGGSLEPLVEATQQIFEEMQTPTLDESNVLPFDQLKLSCSIQ
eukprot:1623513-Ditylum_brightwellii.AAC.1